MLKTSLASHTENVFDISAADRHSVSSNYGCVTQTQPWMKIHYHDTLGLRQNGSHFSDDIFKCISFNKNVWISMISSLKLFLLFQLIIFQHWLRWWLGAGQATSHYLNQWWLAYWSIYASLCVNKIMGRVLYINSSWSNYAIWHHGCWSSSDQIPDWTFSVPSLYLNQCWHIVNYITGSIFHWNLIWIWEVYIHEYVCEHVCKMAASMRWYLLSIICT